MSSSRNDVIYFDANIHSNWTRRLQAAVSKAGQSSFIIKPAFVGLILPKIGSNPSLNPMWFGLGLDTP
jgi:hypothetical protein